MKFSIEGIQNLTFPTGTRGYKKRDVDDFLSYIVKDYESYQRQLEYLREEKEIVETEKQEIEKKMEKQTIKDSATIEMLKRENEKLKQEVDDFQTSSLSNYFTEDATLSLAQKIALRIERQAKEEAQKIKEEAEQYYQEQVKKLDLRRLEIGAEVGSSLSEVIDSERVVVASIDTFKQEYVRLMSMIRGNYEQLITESEK